jgi:hypothetical protein
MNLKKKFKAKAVTLIYYRINLKELEDVLD